MAKNYAIGRHLSTWWNEGQDGKQGYRNVVIRRRYKDKAGLDAEEKITLFVSEFLELCAEMEAMKDKILLLPREIVKKEDTTPEPNMQVVDVNDLGDIPF